MWKIVSLVLSMLVYASDARSPLAAHKMSLEGNSKCAEQCVSAPLEISFVVDGSRSIWQMNFTFGLDFIEDFVNAFTISPTAVRVSMVTFGRTEHAQFDLDTYTDKAALKKAISRIPYPNEDYTNTSAGIDYAVNVQKPKGREGVRHVMIVMTDGNSQEWRLTKIAAAAAKTAGLEVFAIGIGHDVSGEELHNIASEDRHVFMVSSYSALADLTDRLTHETCDVPTYPECKMEPVDLSFVIDSSTSIGSENFTLGRKFVKDFVNSFLINQESVRVSAVTFDHNANKDDSFGFDQYKNKKDLLDAIDAIPYNAGGYTNTGGGIEFMRERQMIHNRTGAVHVCIVMTDGNSQQQRKTFAQAKLSRDRGIVMYSVGIGVNVTLEELRGIASDDSHVLRANNYAELNLLKEELTNKTCIGVLDAIREKAEIYRNQPVPHASE